MKTIISAEEVVRLALGGEENVPAEAVNEAVIMAAQRKFLRPVLNGLCAALMQGRHEHLADNHIKPALAHYVKYLMLPSLAAQTGGAGVVQPSGTMLAPADEKALRRLLKRVRSDADTLLATAVEHIEAHKELYPEYDPHKNILHHCSIVGGIFI